MANLKENNLHNLRLNINKDDYWDFFVDKDNYGAYYFDNKLYDKCLISYINACDKNCLSGDTWLYSLKDYYWKDSVSIENTMYDISYTGTDNGLFKFRKDRISNEDFWNLYQNNKFKIDENDFRLKLHAVSGNTLQYEYPLHVENCQIKLNGGFYQGFFSTECDKYKVLPTELKDNDTWEFEFQIKKCELEKESTKTLNDKHPNNKGIFFYMGTRAENKWSYLYNKDDEDKDDNCFTLSPDEYVEDAHIDKKDYLIGNFYDLTPDFEETPIDDYVEDYTNYNYYDLNLYKKNCDDEIFGLEDFADFPSKPKQIDETQKHIHFDGWCCNLVEEKVEKKENKTFFRHCMCKSCGCGSINKTVINDENENNTKKSDIDDLLFDNGYIDNFNGIDYDTDYWQPELDISDFDYQTSKGISFKDGNKKLLFTTDNKFLMFNRTCTGYTTDNWVEGTQMEVYGKKSKFKDNLFILMNRTCTGYTVDNIEQMKESENSKYDMNVFYNDLYNNAIAFRITDNGEIGYRLLTSDCSKEGNDKTSIEEGYSFPNAIKECEWATIHVKIKTALNRMKLYFYVNGKLVYITKELPKINFRTLDENYEKQEGVPYNISIGGGTQGLAETILPNYMLNPTKVYPLEKYFAGTFIGYIKSFKFYDCDLEYGDILGNYKYEVKNMNTDGEFL